MNKKYLILTSALAVGLFSSTVIADQTKTANNPLIPIKINSDHQFVDLNENTVTFTGNVIVTRENAILHADKVVIKRVDNSPNTIDAYGKPAKFTNKLEDGKIINGQSDVIHYDIPKDYVTLTGNAYLEQEGNTIEGNRITYLTKEQKMTASGDPKKGQRINTVIIPSQIETKKK